MDEVADSLFVGTTEDAEDESLLSEHGITDIISLTHSPPDGGFPTETTVVNVPMVDGPRNDPEQFDRAVTEVLSRLDDGNGHPLSL